MAGTATENNPQSKDAPGTSGEGDVPQTKKAPRPGFGKRWFRFRILSPNSSILRGSYAINSPHFKYRSRGRQAAPASVVAIVYGTLFEPKEWIADYVDQTLEYADKVFRTSVMRNRVKEDEYMKTKLIHPEFYIANYKVFVCIEETGIYGNLFSETVGCPDFADGLRKFFESSDSGVITAQGTSMAMWRQPELGFLYFDPAPCNEEGVRHADGTACVMRFKCLADLCEHFLKSMDKGYDSRYCMDKVTVLRVNEVGRGYIDRIPSSNRLSVDKSVLRSINPVDIDENKMDCTKPVPKGEKTKASTTAKIHREPLSITISNYSIDKRFATDPLVDQNNFDTGYTYANMHVNVPSTFRELPGNMAIIHGLTHEGSDVYRGKGAQTVANCVMAIAMKKVHPVKTWLRPKLDEILTLGDLLYETVKAEKPMIRNMAATDLYDTKIQVDGRKLVVDVDLITITGTISSKIPTVLNLKQAMEEFFLVNTEGVIESSSMSVAVWIRDDCYYMFDPRQCDSLGVRVREDKGKGKADAGDKVKGNSCAIRFPNTDTLAALFLRNVDHAKKNDRFTIRHITILDDVPGTRVWNDFQPGTPGETWILRGTTSNEDEEFEDETRGIQGLAIPVVALISAKETPPARWIDETIDTAIREGDAYYLWCNPPTETEEEEERFFFVPNLKKQLYFKNRKVIIDVEEGTIVGDLEAAPGSDIPHLVKGLQQFFEQHQFGILNLKNLDVAIWRFDEDVTENDDIIKRPVYYCFDPNPRNSLGFGSEEDEEGGGVACVIRTLDLSVLARVIETNAGQDPDSDNEFYIHSMKSINIGNEMTDEEIEADKLIPVKPDLYNYYSVMDTGAILLGSFNQGNEAMFKRHTRDKQQGATALVTLAMTKLYNPHLWYREVVDDVLKLGDRIAMENLENLEEEEGAEEEAARTYLLPSEINADFTVGVNRFSFELEEEIASGKMTDLQTQLEIFFEANNMGIFRQGEIIMPVWKEADVYFTMDPKGRDTRGEPRERDGTAGVMWFIDTESLVTAIEAVAIGEDFVIDVVTLSNAYETRLAEEERPPKPSSGDDPWYHFPKIAEGVWSIDGTVKMDDERFEEANRNQQTAAIAVMSIVFSKVYEPRYWTQEVVNEIIATGDKLHSKCVERLGEGSIPRINDIITEFFLSTRRINLTIKDCVEAGRLTAKPPKVQDLQTGVDKFFSRYVSGALCVSGNKNIPIWKSGTEYYALIPDWAVVQEETTTVAPKVLRFAISEILVSYILEFLGNDGDYEMIAINVVNWNKLPPWKFDPSSAVRPSNLPPLNAYRRVQGEARAILRGSYHQGDEIFPESLRNRQTAANCVVALGMSVVKNPITWTKKTMDEILAIGTNVHRETQKAKPTIVRIKPKDIIRVFYVGVNILTADIESGTSSGIVAIPPPVPEDKRKKRRGAKRRARAGRGKKSRGPTRIRAPPPPPILLEQGVQLFFQNNGAGILTTDRGMVAIWKSMGVYFMYDPRARSDQGLPDFYGRSCVMWFACIEPLYEVLFANIDEQEKYGRYEICRVIIKTAMIEPLPCPAGFRPYFDCTTPPIPVTIMKKNTTLDVETVTDYNFVDEELSVLRGSLHMHHRTWNTISRGFQSTAIAAVAIVVGLLHVPSTWTSDLIDAILRYGDLLHSDSVRAARPGFRNLSPSELLTVFIVGDFRATIHIHNHTTAGLLHTFDLSESLAMFFRSNCAGILHTTNMAVAVMQHYGKFYLFDPCARNELGKPSFDGAACIMKCENIMKMAKVFVTNCNLKTPNVYTLNAVNVLNMYFFSDAKTGCPPKCEQ